MPIMHYLFKVKVRPVTFSKDDNLTIFLPRFFQIKNLGQAPVLDLLCFYFLTCVMHTFSLVDILASSSWLLAPLKMGWSMEHNTQLAIAPQKDCFILQSALYQPSTLFARDAFITEVTMCKRRACR